MILSKYGIQFHPENSRIRCLAHVVNLVAQAILGDLKEADDPDVDDYFPQHRKDELHIDPDQSESCEGGANDYSDEDNEEDAHDDEIIQQVIKELDQAEADAQKAGGAVVDKPTLSAVKKVRICFPLGFDSLNYDANSYELLPGKLRVRLSAVRFSNPLQRNTTAE